MKNIFKLVDNSLLLIHGVHSVEFILARIKDRKLYYPTNSQYIYNYNGDYASIYIMKTLTKLGYTLEDNQLHNFLRITYK